MNTNISDGQLFDRVDVYLPEKFFAHVMSLLHKQEIMDTRNIRAWKIAQ